jgi:hypothetical protein
MDHELMQSVRSNGADMRFVERGTGAPLVLAHGTLGDCRSLTPQMKPSGARITAQSPSASGIAGPSEALTFLEDGKDAGSADARKAKSQAARRGRSAERRRGAIDAAARREKKKKPPGEGRLSRKL